MRIKLSNYRYGQLQQIKDNTGMDEKTVVYFSICNGIHAIRSGFYPKIGKETLKEQEIEVEFTKYLRENLREIHKILCFQGLNFTNKKLIETLVDVEIENLARIWNDEYEEDCEEINIRIKVPKKVKMEVENIQKNIGISRNRIQQYFFLNGYQDFMNNVSPPFLKTDENLKDFISNLNVDVIKGRCIAEYIIKYKYRKVFGLTDTVDTGI